MSDPYRSSRPSGSYPAPTRTPGKTKKPVSLHSPVREKPRSTSAKSVNSPEQSYQATGQYRRAKPSSSTRSSPAKPAHHPSPAKSSLETSKYSQNRSRQASSNISSRSSNDRRPRDQRNVNRAPLSTLSNSSSYHPYRRSRSHRLSHDRGRLHEHIQSLRPPSLMSLLSSLSKTTHSSSGSNSTVTQDSYATALHREGSSRPIPQEMPRQEHSHMDTVDVFQYLEPDSHTLNEAAGWHSDDSSSSSSSSPPPSPPSDDADRTSRASTATPVSYSSGGSPASKSSQVVTDAWHDSDHFLSDSGIGMVDDRYLVPPSHYASSTAGSHRYMREAAGDGVYYKDPNQSPYMAYQDSTVPLMDGHGPGPCVIRLPSPISPLPQHSSHARIPPQNSHTSLRTGYDLLASNLSAQPRTSGSSPAGTPLIPLYRRFETLNHRILLHLQDELQELEDELRVLDECIAAAHPVADVPASRRLEHRHGGELHFRRTELLGRVMMKMGQYSQALSAYRGLVAPADRANTASNTSQIKQDAVRRYRAWVAAYTPIAPQETAFLQHEEDLIAVFANSGSDLRQNRHMDLRTALTNVYQAILELTPHPASLMLCAILVLVVGISVLFMIYSIANPAMITTGAVLGVVVGAVAWLGGAFGSQGEVNDLRQDIRAGRAHGEAKDMGLI